jgi:hypothetical protein
MSVMSEHLNPPAASVFKLTSWKLLGALPGETCVGSCPHSVFGVLQ